MLGAAGSIVPAAKLPWSGAPVAAQTPDRGVGTRITEHRIVNEGLRLRVWLVLPGGGQGPMPAVVWNHGSQVELAADLSLRDYTAVPQVQGDGAPWRAWAEALGIALVIPEGRGYGASEGPRPLDSIIDPVRTMDLLAGRARDTVAATEWASRQPAVREDRIVVAGSSHGGVVSLLASALRAYAGTALMATGAWYRRADVGLAALRAAAAAGQGPMLVQHMLTDSLVPVAVSRAISEAALAAGRPCELREYPGVPGVEGHASFAPANRAQWTADFNAFLRSCFAG